MAALACHWCGAAILLPVRWGYHIFCSERHLQSYLGWVEGAAAQLDTLNEMDDEDTTHA